MGTSRSYESPPAWGGLKAAVTRTGGGGTRAARGLVSDYIGQNGGAAGVARRGAGGGGRGGAGRTAASRFAGFASRVAEVGLPQALRDEGLAHLIGQPVNKLVHGLIDYFCGPGSTFDQVDARNAMSRLNERLLGDAESPEQVEAILNGIVQDNKFGVVMMEYFAYLVYEEFMRSFYEQVLQRHGQARADSMSDDILAFVLGAIENKVLDISFTEVKWAGAQGRQIAQQVMEQTLRVFGG